MSSDLERRLEAMLAEAPEPERGAGEEALHRALRSLRPVAPPHRGLRAGVLAFAGVVVLLVIAAGSLGAAGALHVSFGTKPRPKPHPVVTQLSLPKGADGVAALVDERLSVATRGGFRLQGLRGAGSAALSPHAVYVAAGIGDSLVVMAPDGRRVWSHAAGGQVVAIAWAPDAIRIAYVVRGRHRLALHVIWGTGIHDKVVDPGVRGVRPSWRADSLALAYVSAGGKANVYDLEHRSHTVVGPAAPVTRLAFAPVGKTLLVGTPDAASVSGRKVAAGAIEAIGWFDGDPAVALAMRRTARIRTFGPGNRVLDDFVVPGRVVSFSGGLVVTRTEDAVLAGWREKTVHTLLRVSPATSVEDVVIG